MGPAIEIYNKDTRESSKEEKNFKFISTHAKDRIIYTVVILIEYIHTHYSHYHFKAIEMKDFNIVNNPIVTIEKTKAILKVPKNKQGVYYVQYKKPLVPERRFFFIEINKIG
jgi:hypothetical protein